MANKDNKKTLSTQEEVLKYLGRIKKELSTVNNKSEEDKSKKDKKITDIEKLEKAISNLMTEYDDLKWKNQISATNEINLKNRFLIEKTDIIKYNGADLAKNVLVPFDMLKRVISLPSPSPEVDNYLKGFEMVVGQMDNAFTEAGIEVIKTKVGDDFDQNIHEAVETIETEAQAKGKVAHIISNGYKLKDRVIIYTKVKVSG
ncbi:nucleotide exchange factor GrpE [Spiroplasma endosymbiont of Aspidapion aeneum]|uniref:nucleotide exchange factor GrpE n=1 Tax=Spiroplasma endosymbiont of Aspidapion aeneum TaxID=3066276 RepID=UPI00313B463A